MRLNELKVGRNVRSGVYLRTARGSEGLNVSSFHFHLLKIPRASVSLLFRPRVHPLISYLARVAGDFFTSPASISNPARTPQGQTPLPEGAVPLHSGPVSLALFLDPCNPSRPTRSMERRSRWVTGRRDVTRRRGLYIRRRRIARVDRNAKYHGHNARGSLLPHFEKRAIYSNIIRALIIQIIKGKATIFQILNLDSARRRIEVDGGLLCILIMRLLSRGYKSRALRYSLVQLARRRIASVNANGQFCEIKLNEQRDEFKLGTKIINPQVLSDKLNVGS